MTTYSDLKQEDKPQSYGGSSEEAHRTASYVDSLFHAMETAGWTLVPPPRRVLVKWAEGTKYPEHVLRRAVEQLVDDGTLDG